MISLTEIEDAYNRYSREIFTYILRSVYNHEAAEDILQDVFIKLIHYSQKKDVNARNMRALLYTIARSVCIDSARSASSAMIDYRDISDIPDNTQCSEKASGEMLDAVNVAIGNLDEPEKSIILLRQNGLTYHEISGIMKIPERTLKRKASNAIISMRKELRKQGFFISTGTDGTLNTFND